MSLFGFGDTTGGAGVAELPLVRPVSMSAFIKPAGAPAGQGSSSMRGGLPVGCFSGKLNDIILGLYSP